MTLAELRDILSVYPATGPVSDDNLTVYLLRKSGSTYSAAARVRGITTERARQICFRVDKMIADRTMPLAGLSRRTYNVLTDNHLNSREDISAAGPNVIKSWVPGSKSPTGNPNFGKKCMKEVFDFMGWNLETTEPRQLP